MPKKFVTRSRNPKSLEGQPERRGKGEGEGGWACFGVGGSHEDGFSGDGALGDDARGLSKVSGVCM